MKTINFEDLNDEQVLKEFVKRFKVDGAILVYCDGENEYGFARFRNKEGRKWAKAILKIFKER